MATKLIYFLYRFLELAALPFILLYVAARGARDRRYFHSFGERLGFVPESCRRKGPGGVWVHAVSVGEILTAIQLLRTIRSALPGAPVFVSTTTLAGRAMAEQKLAGIADAVFYFPFDYVSCVRRVLRNIRPAVAVVLETEIWPNCFREVKRSGAALLIVNGRISDRAAPRYARLRWFFRHALAHADRIVVQTPRDRERYLAAGASAEKVVIGGNMKFDFEPQAHPAPEVVMNFIERVHPSAVWIAASTMPPAEADDPDEDDAVIAAFRSLAAGRPGLLLMLAPRRPERFDEVASKLDGLSFVRRARLTDSSRLDLPGVLLVDTIGELSSLFAVADVVFMGGTLPHRGGHNILEPAFHSRAVIAGPHMENFAAIAEEFTAAGALVRIKDGGELASAVADLLDHPERRREIGERAFQLAQNRRGATRRAADEIVSLAGCAIPAALPSLPERLILWPLARLWEAGSRLRQRRMRRDQRRVDAKVISVGAIAVGGAGKTPFVLWLAARLKERGLNPAFLTRGYRRKSPEPVTLIPAGGPAATARTGDEAQLFVRSGLGPVAIGADRVRAAQALVERHRPSVIVLDDGFQHQRLARDLDIVLIDSLDPLAGGDLFPLGRLREPWDALQRADILVLTRTAPGRSYEAVERMLRRYNSRAPAFHARVNPICWTDGMGEWPPEAPPGAGAIAFCGLANPASFWNTLDAVGVRTAMRFAFGDHHTYRPVELLRLAQHARRLGAGALLTTEKDAMNLPDGAAQLVSPAKVYWLKIGLTVDREEELLALAVRASSSSSHRL